MGDHPEIDGLVIANNLMAIGALEALHKANVDVPGDIAVVGIDDPPWASLVSPAMTTLAQPTQSMATMAFDLLVGRIRKERSVPREMVYQFDFAVAGIQRQLILTKISAQPNEAGWNLSSPPRCVRGE